MKAKSNRPDVSGAESGMMVVEAVIGFTTFLIVCLTIIFLINIFMLHNRIQFAINSAAHEIAAYSYIYDAFGARDAEKQIASDGEKFTQPIDDTTSQVVDTLNKMQNTYSQFGSAVGEIKQLDSIDPSKLTNIKKSLEELTNSAGDTVESTKKSISDVKELFSDGNALLAGLIYMGESGASYLLKSGIGTAAAWGMTGKYLKTADRTADEYLRSFGVIDGYDGLDFSGSTIFNDSDLRVIDIVVEYDVDLSFANFVLPYQSVHIVQRVSLGGWVGGDNRKVTVGLTK